MSNSKKGGLSRRLRIRVLYQITWHNVTGRGIYPDGEMRTVALAARLRLWTLRRQKDVVNVRMRKIVYAA